MIYDEDDATEAKAKRTTTMMVMIIINDFLSA